MLYCIGIFRIYYIRTVQLLQPRLQIDTMRFPHRRQYGKRCVVGPPLHRTHTLNQHDCIVHGSLARAGKVKSQTPKVEKQEKQKTPRGRAKKRLLYNRRYARTQRTYRGTADVVYRFVNVTTLPGGKRRMYVLPSSDSRRQYASDFRPP